MPKNVGHVENSNIRQYVSFLCNDSRQQTICFRGTAQFFRFCLWRYLKTTVHSTPTENEQTLQKSKFCVCQTIRNCPGNCKRLCDSPWFYASMRALLQAEDILGIGCELRLEKPYELNSYWSGKCTVDVLCQLHARYYTVTVFIFERNHSANSKTTHLWIHVKEKFFTCFDVENSPLKHAKAF